MKINKTFKKFLKDNNAYSTFLDELRKGNYYYRKIVDNCHCLKWSLCADKYFWLRLEETWSEYYQHKTLEVNCEYIEWDVRVFLEERDLLMRMIDDINFLNNDDVYLEYAIKDLEEFSYLYLNHTNDAFWMEESELFNEKYYEPLFTSELYKPRSL